MFARGLTAGHSRTRACRERGAVAVEFALVLPLLVMLLLGITTAGLSYSRAIGLTNAVREGARFGATADATNGNQWAADVIARVRATQFDDPSNEATVCAQLWIKGGTTPTAGACNVGDAPVSVLNAGSVPPILSSASLPANACIVRVMAARNFSINIGLANWDRVNASSSVARYERMDVVTTCV